MHLIRFPRESRARFFFFVRKTNGTADEVIASVYRLDDMECERRTRETGGSENETAEMIEKTLYVKTEK